MANTVTNTRLVIGRTKVVQYISISSDGTEETDLVIYDSSAVATALGVTDPLNCLIDKIIYSSNSLAGVVHLDYDATTDVLAWALPAYSGASKYDFKAFGGLRNTGAVGRTGDILLTTLGLAPGDSVTLVVTVNPSIN
jgi:hypothetical protein